MSVFGILDVDRIKETFDLLGERVFEDYMQRYIFSSQMSVKEIIDLFKK